MTPIVIIDTREQDPLPVTPFRRGTLYSADYSFAGGEELFGVERKSLPDLVASLSAERARFENELHRLRGYRFARLLVVGDETDLAEGRYRSRMHPTAAVNSLHALEARYVPVVWAATPEAAAALVMRWAFWFRRELLKPAEAEGD